MEVFYKELNPSFNVIDLRDRYEYNAGHYTNSINIPYRELLNNPSRYLNKNMKYYLYCTSGIRSKRATELLSLIGYNVVNVKDGYQNKLF